MARIAGRQGRLYIGATSSAAASPVAATKSWTLDAQTDYIDATAQGDTAKQFVAGLPGGSGSFEAFYSDSEYTGNVFTAAADGLARAFYMYPDKNTASKYWFGTAFFSGSVTSDVGGVTSISGKFSAASDIIAVGIS